DQTMGICETSASLRLPRFISTRRNASSARMRVKSLTPPLPSVLPMTATTSSAVNCPLAIQASRPDASLTVFTSIFATSIAIASNAPEPRFCFAAQHDGESRAAVNHFRGRTRPTKIAAQPRGRVRVDLETGTVQHDAVVVAGRGRRYLAFDHVALHQFG